MKMRGGLVLVLGLFLVLFSLSFVSADYWTDWDYQGYCNPSTKYVSLGHATSYSGKTFSNAEAEKELCTLLPANILLNIASISTTRLAGVGDTAYCSEGSIVYGFQCLSPGPDCQYNDHVSDIYCVALSGNYDYSYSNSASSKTSINCPAGTFVSGYYAVSSDTLQLRCVTITSACVPKTCASAEYSGKCGVSLANDCGGTISCPCASGVCNTSVAGQVGTCITGNLVTANWKNSLGNIVNNISVGQAINLSVSGTSLTGLNINYTIYNSTGKRVYNLEHLANSATSDSITWTPSIVLNYTFNATIVLMGQGVSSGVLKVKLACVEECNASDFRLVCLGNNVHKETCGNYDADECLEYGNSVLNKTCSASQTCLNGACSDVPYTIPESCFSYNTAGTCAAYNKTVAKKDVDNYLFSSFGLSSMPVGGFCGTNNIVKTVALFNGICNYTAVNCSCGWNSTCGKSFDLKRTCTDSTKNAGGNCDISIDVQNTCGSPGGKITQKITAIWKVTSGDLNYKPEKGVCESKNFEYPCPSTQKLPFFGFWNFVISLSLIAVIYAFLNNFKNKFFRKNL